MKVIFGMLAGVALLFGWLTFLSAKASEFAKRRKQQGHWDDSGPLKPTSPPLGWLYRRGEYFSDDVAGNSKRWFKGHDSAPVAASPKKSAKNRNEPKDR